MHPYNVGGQQPHPYVPHGGTPNPHPYVPHGGNANPHPYVPHGGNAKPHPYVPHGGNANLHTYVPQGGNQGLKVHLTPPRVHIGKVPSPVYHVPGGTVHSFHKNPFHRCHRFFQRHVMPTFRYPKITLFDSNMARVGVTASILAIALVTFGVGLMAESPVLLIAGTAFGISAFLVTPRR